MLAVFVSVGEEVYKYLYEYAKPVSVCVYGSGILGSSRLFVYLCKYVPLQWPNLKDEILLRRDNNSSLFLFPSRDPNIFFYLVDRFIPLFYATIE